MQKNLLHYNKSNEKFKQAERPGLFSTKLVKKLIKIQNNII